MRLKPLAFAALFAFFAFVQPGRSTELIVAADTAFVPFEFKEGDKYVGFDIDLWEAIAQELGLTYKLQPMDFNGIIPALQTKQVDVALAAMYALPERQKVIDFSDGYYESGFTLMVRADSDIKGPEDLAGKILATKAGTANVDYAKEHFKETEIRQFPNIDNAYLELQTGRVDVAFGDTPNVLYYIAKAGKGNVKAVGEPMMAQQYHIAFPKGSPLVAQVNQVLANMKADGRYAAIYQKWFGVRP